MLDNSGWANLIPTKRKYTPALAAKAAKLLESGESLCATARTLHISRASLRNWAKTDPTLRRAFETFEANKRRAQAQRQRIRHFKEVANGIVEAARDGSPDPVQSAVQTHEQIQTQKPTNPPVCPEETRARRLKAWWESDWSEEIEAQQAQLQANQEQAEITSRQGLWCG